ncbi:MAG TPA: SGNH/GDSL hydrolase family protein [Tepidisphaeraceae bacterium]|nr:SGNH/GDSL hydrolase family protein [Tepidisphaeraceae bacterium]
MLRSTALAVLASAATAVATSAFAVAAAPSLNLQSALADTKALLSSGQSADIVVLGDSLSFRQGSYLPHFRNLLQQNYGDGGAGYQGMSLWTGASLNNGWRRVGINADLDTRRSLDGLWNEFDGSTAGANTAYFRPTNSRIELQYISQPGGGSFNVREGTNGAIVATINTNGAANQVQTFDYQLPASQTQYTIEPLRDGRVTILGQNNLSSETGVRVHRAANGGWGVNNFLTRDSTFDQQLALLGTDLVMIWLGQNDQAYNQVTYAQRVNSLVDRVQSSAPGAEIVLIGTYDQGSAALAGLVEGMADVASARGLGFINLYGTAGNAEFFNRNGYLDDGVHFSQAGGRYLGEFLYDAFVSDGASLVPEPAALSALLVAGSLLLRRR